MKKGVILLISLLMLNVSFSCTANSVEIFTESDIALAQSFLIFQARYTYFDNSTLYYFGVNDSSMNIKLTEESITFHSLNSSTNWTMIIGEELSVFNSIGVLNITEEEIIYLSQRGCCGVYKDGVYSTLNDCSETFTVPLINNSSSWFAVLLSFLPALSLAVYLSRKNLKAMLVFLLGGAGWLIAYLLREPLLIMIQTLELIPLLVIASLLAGVFEEGMRFLIIRYVKIARENPLILGLGWGVFEAVLIYALSISFLLLMNQAVTFSDALPGAFERISAVILHASLTMIVFKSLSSKKFLLLAVFLHFFANIVSAVTAYILMLNVWLVEIIILVISLLTAYFAYIINKEGEGFVKKRRSAKRAKKE